MKSFLKKLKGRKGQSMAEFAVTTAMMATLATTAAPKFSGVGEGAKGKKTEAEIDKIVKAGSNFYNAKVTSEGRGRFPGQEKYDVEIGGYTHGTNTFGASGTVDGSSTTPYAEYVEDQVKAWKSTTQPAYELSEGSNWCSVFGIANTTGGQTFPGGSVIDDPIFVANTPTADGDREWLNEFGENPIKSPFQDGHYIYIVVPGGGAGNSATAPTLFVADLESPGDYYKKYAP
jgi:hypothetical protein